jgi:hypothetical protein
MLRKMFEQALGELMEEMAPTRPTIDPVEQRRRPDMSNAPTDGEVRRAIGEARVEPARPATSPERRRVVNPADREGRRANMGEGRNAPREAPLPEGRQAFREPTIPHDVGREAPRTNLRELSSMSPGLQVTVNRSANPLRGQLTNPASVRNAFRIMEILRPPVALRGLPGQERDR